ncbi:MAG: hypothetical protein ACJ731_04675 [Vicinamibacterales bacterium]
MDALQRRDHSWLYGRVLRPLRDCPETRRSVSRRRFSDARIDRGLGLFRRYELLAAIVPVMLLPPTPFRIFVLLAGLAGVRPVAFTLGIAIGRGFRFGGEGWLAYKYGAQAT